MLLIGDDLLLSILEINEKLKLEEFLNKKIFTVSDTPLSYRQVNSLDMDNLLTKDRNKKEGWRKFSFKELVYILIVHELKKFGLKHEQLKSLWAAFFKELSLRKDKKVADIEVDKGIGEIAIGCVFGQVEILLSVDDKGRIVFYDPIHFALFNKAIYPQLIMNLNTIVNGLLEKIGKKPIPISRSLTNEYIKSRMLNIKPTEKELLKIIRNEQYTAIRIKKKNGDISLVYGEKAQTSDKGAISAPDLIKLIEEKQFQDINIVKRDGKIVNYKVEEAYKL